ncbi:MAG: hypothetical protein AB7O96_02710 [Pseudobdellovibrionaceae bacterium]
MEEKDVFDEFEFKPLTEGLGFHKKSINLREKIGESDILSDRLAINIPNKPVEKTDRKSVLGSFELNLETPLPRKESKHKVATKEEINHDIDKLIESLRDERNEAPSSPLKKPLDLPKFQSIPDFSVNEVSRQAKIPSLEVTEPTKGNSIKPLDKVDFKIPAHTPFEEAAEKKAPLEKAKIKREEKLVPSLPSAMGGLVDGLVVAFLTLVALIVMLMTIKVDLVANMIREETGGEVMLSILGLIIGVAWIYSTVARTFVFATIGDWVVDQQIGTEQEKESEMFPVKVALRFVLSAVTGFILFPILSYFMKKDILGSLLGATLVERKLV